MKKAVVLTVIALLLSVGLLGCTSGGGEKPTPNAVDGKSGEKVTLSMFGDVTSPELQLVYGEILKDFEKDHPNIHVDVQFPGKDYESVLKVRMAANDLPDIIDTQGWAKIRYGKYLADLKEEEWASKLTKSIKPVITDETGKVFALVVAEAKDGLFYNPDILKQYNIEVPKTFDELMAAGEKIKQESKGSVIPFFFSGIDSSTFGQYYDWFANSLLISPKNNEAQALLDHTFDWNKWTPLAKGMLSMKEKGLMSSDVLTVKVSDLPQLFTQGKVAFSFTVSSFASDVWKIKPDANIGIMPIPAFNSEGIANFSGGERYTLAATKDSKHLKEAKEVIAFFAKPGNLTKISDVSSLPVGILDIKSSNKFAPYYEKYKDVLVLPYFDRVYLPNGMWPVIKNLGTQLVAGTIKPEQFSKNMESEVARLSKNQ